METKPRTIAIYFLVAGLWVVSLSLAGCKPTSTPTPTSTPLTATSTPEDTSNKNFMITDFEAVHSPVKNDPYTYLIFGNLPVSPAAQDVSPDLAVFLGRWEGFDYSPPVKKDNKGVLFIQEISAQGGKAFLWAGTNLQYPYWIKEFQFKVVPGMLPAIEWETDLTGIPGMPPGKGTFRFAYDRKNQTLRGGLDLPDRSELDGPFHLTRDKTFYVYKDYSQYLASKRISSQAYQNKDLSDYGAGYMLYLPEGYEDDPTKTWPLIFFLHGSGDRGDNINLLAKASPFMFIREKGPLPFIIIAPLLKTWYKAFPLEYMDGVLAEVQTTYRVDPLHIYVTGLSLGGEATYRFAIHRPNAFAAIVPLSAWLGADQISLLDGIKGLPVWAIHGADDMIVPLTAGEQPADALKKLEGNIQFTVLAGHDHDTWTDTYSDPAFYDWLLQHQKP